MSNEFNNLKLRTQKFALGIINLTKTMDNSQASKVISNQLLRAATLLEPITEQHAELVQKQILFLK